MRVRKILTAVAAVAVAVGATTVAIGAAGAAEPTETVTRSFSASCPFSVPGLSDVPNRTAGFSVDLDVPTAVVAGQPTGPIPFRGRGSSAPDLSEGSPLRGAFAQAGAVSVTAAIKVNLLYYSFSGSGEQHSAQFSSEIPLSGGAIAVEGSGTLPPLTFAEPRAKSTAVWMSGYTLLLTPRRADGSTTGYGTITAGCLTPPSFFPWIDLAVTPSATTVAHTTTATGRLGRTPVDFGAGTLSLTRVAASEMITGGLTAPSAATVDTRVLGVIPTTATVRLSSSPIGGTLPGPLTGQATVAVSDLSVLGVPVLRGSTTCRSTGPLTFTPGAGFTFAGGGTLAGTFETPAFTGCGAFGGFLGSLFSGKANTLSVTATRA